MQRFELSDDPWLKVENLLPGRSGDPGKNNRLFLDAVLWLVRTGVSWRDLAERFGEWNSVFQRFNRWANKGVWQRVFDALQHPDLEWARTMRPSCEPICTQWAIKKKRETSARLIRNQDSRGLRRTRQPREVFADARPNTRHPPLLAGLTTEQPA